MLLDVGFWIRTSAGKPLSRRQVRMDWQSQVALLQALFAVKGTSAGVVFLMFGSLSQHLWRKSVCENWDSVYHVKVWRAKLSFLQFPVTYHCTNLTGRNANQQDPEIVSFSFWYVYMYVWISATTLEIGQKQIWNDKSTKRKSDFFFSNFPPEFPPNYLTILAHFR